MKIAGIACGLLCIFLAAASPLNAQSDHADSEDQKMSGDHSPAGDRKDYVSEAYGGDSWIEGLITDDSDARQISYPFHDLRYLRYRVQEILNYRDEIDENKKFILSTNRAGVTFVFNIEGYVTISVFNGIQFASSYYLTKNILDPRPDRQRIASAYVFEVNARGFLYSLNDSK